MTLCGVHLVIAWEKKIRIAVLTAATFAALC